MVHLLLYLSTSSCRASTVYSRRYSSAFREKTETLVLGDDDILTHEAADVAYALGVKVIRETGSGIALKRIAPVASNLPPLKVVRMANVQVEPFLEGKTTPGTNVWLKDVVVTQDRSPMGAGYMSLDKARCNGLSPTMRSTSCWKVNS